MSRKLNNLEVYKAILDQLDEAGSPRWDYDQYSRFFNQAYADWLKTTTKNLLEKNEQARRDLGPLIVTQPLRLTGGSANLEALKPSLYRIVSIKGEWERTIPVRGTGRIRQRLDKWPVSPLTHDQEQLSFTDPWNAPSDENAKYTEVRQVVEGDADPRPLSLTVHVKTDPTRLSIEYVCEPKLVDLTEQDKSTEVGYDVQIELIRRTVAAMTIPDENYPASQAKTQELQLNSL